MEIIREPTRQELTGDVTDENSQAFVPIELPSGKVQTPKDKFNERLGEEEQKAMKLGKPFAIWAAREDIKEIQENFNKQFRRQGYVKGFKIPTLDEIDWSKYSDLKNFVLLEESEENDAGLTKMHIAPINIRYKKYQYKGYSNTTTVMESKETAIQRALDDRAQRLKGK